MNLALFDLDNTLLTGDSDFEWAQFLISKGIVDRELQEAKNIQFYEQYKAGTLDIHEFLAFQLAPLTRHSRAELDAWHREYMDRHILPIIGTAARTLVNKHLDAGDLCAIVTATNSFVTGPITREFGIPHLIVAINKMELADYSQETYERIKGEYLEFAAKVGIEDIRFIPLSSLRFRFTRRTAVWSLIALFHSLWPIQA